MSAMAMVFDKIRRAVSGFYGTAPVLPHEEAAYRRLSAKGWRPRAIIDVGAYHGEWTRLARRIFPGTPVLMIEAQQGKAERLEALAAELGGVTFVAAMLGSAPHREVTFYEMETGSSYFPEQSNAPRTARTYVTRTLDELADDVQGPLFLKVDVQGAELEVLAGGTATLDRAEVVQLEVAVLPYNKGAPTMLEVLQYMDERGFAPLDIAGFSRPNGVDLVQIDLLFARRESGLRPHFISFDRFASSGAES